MPEAHSAPDNEARDLTAFQKNILIVLSNGPRYGLAIKRELESYYGTEVNHGRLYPNLDDLVTAGLVEKSKRDKRTNEYQLTADGRHLLRERVQWELGKLGQTLQEIREAAEAQQDLAAITMEGR